MNGDSLHEAGERNEHRAKISWKMKLNYATRKEAVTDWEFKQVYWNHQNKWTISRNWSFPLLQISNKNEFQVVCENSEKREYLQKGAANLNFY